MAKEDASSPTVSTESLFLTAVVDALEGRDVAMLDVPGAFMQADMDKLVHVRFTGHMVNMLVDIDPDMYGPHVIEEKGERVMYVELVKALYGTLRAAHLFWEKLSGKLQEWGFTLNPYDPCVANKTVRGKQLTVAWHVDDLKISHVSSKVVDWFIHKMEGEFAKESPLNVSCGKVHEYLGMTLDFLIPGELKVCMADYVQMILSNIPDEMEGKSAMPAANHLFLVDCDAEKLCREKSETYVHYVMQLLYLSQRARPDIHTAVSFLCTRLSHPDIDHYKKLCQVLKYLQSNPDIPLTLCADGSGEIQWWVDASFAVHHDMKGHTGVMLLLGKGAIYCSSTKQKLVTWSSTECEVVGVHDALPQIVWTSQFLESQQFNVWKTRLFQDNMSSILLEKNGRSSSSKRTCHMNIRYFYIKDQVDSGKVTIEYCPTEDMMGDFFTKPLQGALFRKLRALIMNIAPDSKYYQEQRSVLGIYKSVAGASSDVAKKAVDLRTYQEALVGSEM